MREGTDLHSPVGVVAANPPAAARIGARILAEGGNAMDAAVAAGVACCMLRPNQTGIGGYVCAAVVYDAKTRTVWSVDANAVAPSAARPDLYRVHLRDASRPPYLNEWEYFCSVEGDANVHGPRAVAVPGMMAGLGTVHERWGRLAWPAILAPSHQLLSEGFPYEEVAHAVKSMEAVIRRFPATAAHLLRDGEVPTPTDIWHRRGMAGTLERLAKAGWRDFYDGELGCTIADYLQRDGGIVTRADMAAYQPRVTAPHTVTYHGAAVHTAILPHGGFSVLQALNLLDALDLPEADIPEYCHLLAETLKLTWRDRLNYVADPDFSDVPVARLLSKDYAAGRMETIRRFPDYIDQLHPEPVPEPPNGTLHVSTADADGNLVAMTISQGYAFGACVTVPGTGIILGHGMSRFEPRPGYVNSVAPGKRPLNNVCPLIVELPDRRIALGVPGGRRIISVMTRAVQLLVDRHATGRQAAIAPRLHIETHEPLEITNSAGEEIHTILEAMGHQVKPMSVICGVMNCAETLEDGSTRGGSDESVAAPD